MRVIPLGGCGEFGRNLTAYVAAGLLLLVDCGIEMPDDLSPGVDHFVPDLRDLLERAGRQLGLTERAPPAEQSRSELVFIVESGAVSEEALRRRLWACRV